MKRYCGFLVASKDMNAIALQLSEEFFYDLRHTWGEDVQVGLVPYLPWFGKQTTYEGLIFKQIRYALENAPFIRQYHTTIK